MKTRSAILLLACIALLTITAVFILKAYLVVEDVSTIPASARVENATVAGFNVALDSLTFGSMPPKSVSYRSFNVTNKRDYPMRATIWATGSIAPYLRLTPHDFILGSGGSERVEAQVIFPPEVPFGNYTGQVHVRLSKNI